MADQQYTAEQVQAAVEAGLISPQDGELLLRGLEPGLGAGEAIGGALGAVGAGIAGAYGGRALGKMAGSKAGGMADGPMKSALGSMDTGIPGSAGLKGLGDDGMNALGAGAGAVGAGLGGWGGAEAGEAMMPAGPGGGIGGQAGVDPMSGQAVMERDFALRALVDPNVPPDVKKKIMEMLEAYDQENPPAEMGYGEGAPWGAMTGGAAGMGAGGALGSMYADDMGKFMQPGPEADMTGLFNKGRKGLGDALSGSRGKWGAGIAGGLAGAGLGALAGGLISPARPSPYQDPLQ